MLSDIRCSLSWIDIFDIFNLADFWHIYITLLWASKFVRRTPKCLLDRPSLLLSGQNLITVNMQSSNLRLGEINALRHEVSISQFYIPVICFDKEKPNKDTEDMCYYSWSTISLGILLKNEIPWRQFMQWRTYNRTICN